MKWFIEDFRKLLDHTEVRKYSGHAYFVSEPYGLDGEQIKTLAKYVDGFDVRVDARYALHYPGSTLAIMFSKKS